MHITKWNFFDALVYTILCLGGYELLKSGTDLAFSRTTYFVLVILLINFVLAEFINKFAFRKNMSSTKSEKLAAIKLPLLMALISLLGFATTFSSFLLHLLIVLSVMLMGITMIRSGVELKPRDTFSKSKNRRSR